jgi:hypothetical protein
MLDPIVLLVALAKPVVGQILTAVEAKNIPAAEKLPPCISYGAAGYKPKACLIRLDR